MPTADELANGRNLRRRSRPTWPTGLRDLVWALLNTKEFVVNH